MCIVIDTPVMKDIVRDPRKLERILDKLGTDPVSIVLTYTLERQYRNIINIDVGSLMRIFRSISYRVRFTAIPRSREEYIRARCSSLVSLLERALSTKKHSGRDDALVIACSSIYAKSTGAKRLIVVARGRHASFYHSVKHVVERNLNVQECWYSVLNYDYVL